MKSILTYWLVIGLGVLLILPKIGITQLGTLTTGAMSWIMPILILIIGIVRLAAAYKN